MALVTIGYGAFSGLGVWYPINLVAAMAIPGFDEATIPQLERFSVTGLGTAALIHVVSSAWSSAAPKKSTLRNSGPHRRSNPRDALRPRYVARSRLGRRSRAPVDA